MAIDVNILPTKGAKREEAIRTLATDKENAEALFHLTNTEKGNCKKAALAGLALFDYEPAMPTWKKLLKSKSKGELYFVRSRADSLSELIANELFVFLEKIISQPSGYMLSVDEADFIKTYISLMLGKASPKMLDVYRLVADNNDKIAALKFDNNTRFSINDYLRFFEISKQDKSKIFPAILSMSILRTQDTRLVALADELYKKHQNNWLSPVFMTALLTQSAKTVYDDFSVYLKDILQLQASYLFDVLGALYYDPQSEKHVGLLFWGQSKYGEIDASFAETYPLYENLDNRWFVDLMQIGQNNPPKATLQAYNRGGVLYDSFDEMLVEITPYKTPDNDLKKQLSDYFYKQDKKSKDQNFIYIDILNLLRYHIDESSITKYLNCRNSGASIYNLVDVLKSTVWSKDEQLAFFDQCVAGKFKGRGEETIVSCRKSLVDN